MNILFICNKSPYPAKEGGPIAMDRIIDGVIRAGHKVKVLAINSFKYNIDINDVPDEYIQKTGLELEFLDLRIKPLNAFVNLFSNKSYHVQRFISSSFSDKIKEILLSDTYDIVQFETLFITPYIEEIRKYSDAKIVLRAHNIEHLIWQRIADTTKNPLKRFYLTHLANTLKEYELNAIKKFDGIAAITKNDGDFFKNINENVIDIPFAIYTDEYDAEDVEPEFPSLFHIGAMNWMPNEEGIKWFLDEVWPQVNAKFPSLPLYLAGRNMPQWLTNSSYANVKVVGEVDSAMQFIKSKAIMIVPLLSGSGIRIKIIEGMTAARPIVSTTIGAEGIMCTHEKDIMLADTPQEFAASIEKLVESKQFAEMIGENALHLLKRDHDNYKIIEKLIKFYEAICSAA
ncbi:MAG: glycosyltransferase family 4 protein [Bacteroidota bacterium]|nr:glycosyltransferase family 4 protein [Bacteroidota bacterium]